MNTTAFINAVKGQAIKDMLEHGILASLTIAQAILESGWGDSGLTVKANNLFGIKAGSSWTGNKVVMPTTEYYNGVRTSVDATFRAYETWPDSIADHTKLLLTDRYKNLVGVKDYKLACKLIKDDGYATSPTYTEKLISLIEQYNLNDYDKVEVYSNPGNPRVKTMQQELNDLGVADNAGHKLDVDGIEGTHTKEALAKLPTLKKGVYDNPFVRFIQKKLCLKTDGDFGPITETAVKKFQSGYNLVADGIVGPKTWYQIL